MVKSMYVHYGHKQFLKNRFREIRNIEFVKPEGGLWASDVNAEYGWREWCEDETFLLCSEENAFYFELAADANILHIRKKEDLEDLPKQKTEFEYVTRNILDFEALKEAGVDGIELHLSEDHRLYWELYGWDCDSILIMNPDIVQEVAP